MLNLLINFFNEKKATVISILFFIISLCLKFFELNYTYTIFVSIFISGLPFIVNAIKGIKKGIIKTPFLISIAIIASVFIFEYFAAAEIVIILQIGKYLEHYTVNKAKRGISELLSLSPKKVKLVEKQNNILELVDVPISSVKKGQIIRVFAGDIIALDGIVVFGSTAVDQSNLTGESFPIDKGINSLVYSGTLNLSSSIDVLVTKESNESSIQKIISIVEMAQNQKAPIQRIIDKLATKLVPCALIIAIFTFFTTMLLGFQLYDCINRAVTVLVVFCPCALFLSTPTAVMAAIGQATKHNVIIKSGKILEKFAKVNMIAFDKTGTLTYGKLKVEDIITLSNLSKDDFIRIICSLESKSQHPIGKSILNFANENKILLQKVDEFKVIFGKGIEGSICSKKYFLGTEKYLKENNIEIKSGIFEKYIKESKMIIILSDENSVLGFVTLSDNLRDNAIETIKQLKKLSVETILLTGDRKISAKYFSEKLGIKKVKSELLPDEKFKCIRELKKGNTVCMVGDGVNDTPALKLSDVSIAMGKFGSDIVVDTSDVTLITDDISKIPYLKKLSNATLKTIKFNITFSILINITAVILSMFGILNPLLGAIVHNAGALFVIFNSIFLYDRKF